MSTEEKISPELEIYAEGDAILAVLGEAMRVGELKFNDNNECVFTLAKKIIYLLYLDADNTNSIIISIPLGFLPQNDQAAPLMKEMLSGNYCWGMTNGGTLGLDPEQGQVNLNYLVPLPLTQKGQIIDIVSKLAAAAEYWQKKIAKACEGGAAQPAGGNNLASIRV